MQFSSTISSTKNAFSEFLYVEEDHLGNVRAVVSDVLNPHDNGDFDANNDGVNDVTTAINTTPDGIIDEVTADVVSATDYFAFGSEMTGRTYNKGLYAYGFNGKLNENDISGGVGNHLDYGMRIYDPRIAKFLSVDALTKNYPWYTPYQFAGNKPIHCIDIDGMEEQIAIDGTIYSGPLDINVINKQIKEKQKASQNAAMNTPKPIEPASKMLVKNVSEAAGALSNVVGNAADVGEGVTEQMGKAYKTTKTGKIRGGNPSGNFSTNDPLMKTSKVFGAIGDAADAVGFIADGVQIYKANTPEEKQEAQENLGVDIAASALSKWANPVVGVAFSVFYPLKDDPGVQNAVLKQLEKQAANGDMKDWKAFQNYQNKTGSNKSGLLQPTTVQATTR